MTPSLRLGDVTPERLQRAMDELRALDALGAAEADRRLRHLTVHQPALALLVRGLRGEAELPDELAESGLMSSLTLSVSPDPRSALVLFSGGQDSTVCLAWALSRFARVETLGFDYGQRHRIELDCRQTVRQELAAHFPEWAPRLGEDHLLDLSLLGQISDTALTSERAIELQANGLPNTFVPGRNLLFLTFAATLAYRRGATVLVGGMCETDYSGYPDCRDNTLKALQVALSLGLDSPLTLDTPLMFLTKAQTWALSDQLGGERLNALIAEHTHTCYLGERGQRHDWGYGCGHCPACELRAQGHAAWRAGPGA